MDELQLINQIKSEIAYNYLNSKPPLHANDVLSICGVFLFVYGDSVSFFTDSKDISKFGTTYKIFKLLQAFIRAKKRPTLEKYSMQGLMNVFKHEWCPSLNLKTKRDCLKGITIISNIEEEGFVSFKDNDRLYNNLVQRRVVIPDELFGEDDYFEENICLPPNKAIEKEMNSQDDNCELETIKNQLNDHWETNIHNDKYKYIPLVWKLDISHNEYVTFKGLLKTFISVLPQREVRERNAYLDKYAEFFFVYVALWYRWEYQGRTNNALQDIGYPYSAKRIWENCSESYQEYLYFPDEEDGNTSWLNSLYVLGGFPLRYICNEHHFFRLFKEINNPKMDEDEDTLKRISESFDDNEISVYYRSLIQGSYKEYVSELINGNLHIAQEDYNLGIVKQFVEYLEKGKKDYYNDFFKIDWCFYMESHRPNNTLNKKVLSRDENGPVSCVLNLNIGRKDNRCYIQEELLRRESIPNVESLKDFFLYIDYNNGEKLSKLLRFSRTAGKESSFVGWGNSTKLSLPVVPRVGDSISVKIVGINDVNKEKTYTLKDFSINGYFRLFKTNNPYEWSNLTNNKAHSILLFSPSHFSCIPDETVEDIFIGTHLWQLIHLYEDVQLNDLQTGEELKIKIIQGILSVDFKRLPNIIQYNKKNEITYSYYVDDEIMNESMPLLLGENGISKVVFNPYRQGESPKTYKPWKDNNLIIKYKQDTFDYKTFGEELPKTGLIKLYVSDGRHTVVKKCFFVSNPDFVNRDLEHSRFVFSLSDAEVYQADELEYEKESDKVIFNENRDFFPHMDYLTFCVGTKTDYASINIYRARECRELYFEDHRFTEYGNSLEKTKIPFILRSKFRIRTINKDGVKSVFCPQNMWMNPDVNLVSINDRIPNQNIKFDNENDIAYYQYALKRTRNAEYGHYSVSRNVYYKYKFFYWNMRSNNAPFPIETDYDSENKELVVKCNELNDSCIVFQSLKEEQPYNYVCPILYRPNDNWTLKLNRFCDESIVLNCYKVAAEHKVYFAMFYPIRKMVKSQRDLLTIFKKICERKSFVLKPDDYEDLHRFAHEFCFEWFFLSRSLWKGLYKDERLREIIMNLFRTTPFVRKEKEWMERVIELYFSNLHMDFRRDNRSTAGLVLQFIRSDRGDMQFLIDDYSLRIKQLESIYQDTNICYHIYQKLSNLR